MQRYRLFSIGGIPLYVHGTLLWSLGLLVVFLYVSTSDTEEATRTVIAALLTLACVVIHEYGHALAARLRGVHVADVVLHVFFGMTRMEAPGSPGREMFIGVAGPVANLIVAAGMFPLVRGGHHWDGIMPQTAVATLFVINLVLGGLNLIPAFPMDGGRILRAALAIPFGELSATRFAVAIGRGFAIGALIAPLIIGLERWTLIFPIGGAIVLYLGEMESRRVAIRAEDHRLREWFDDAERLGLGPSVDDTRRSGEPQGAAEPSEASDDRVREVPTADERDGDAEPRGV